MQIVNNTRKTVTFNKHSKQNDEEKAVGDSASSCYLVKFMPCVDELSQPADEHGYCASPALALHSEFAMDYPWQAKAIRTCPAMSNSNPHGNPIQYQSSADTEVTPKTHAYSPSISYYKNHSPIEDVT
eukprot:4581504-Amphidinium_carterae.1